MQDARRRSTFPSDPDQRDHSDVHGDMPWLGKYAPMKQSEARVRIIQEWDRWIVTQAIDQDGPTGKDSLEVLP